MNEIEWLNDTEFQIGGVRFLCALHDHSQRTDDQRIVILKDRRSLDKYRTVLADAPPRNVLEFGVFQGGSPAFFTAWLDLAKFVGIDISAPIPAFADFCRRHGLSDRIRTHYGVSQNDSDRIHQIVRDEFGSNPIDLIIDDASHHYKLTRRTFEIAFPLLKPGGVYVVEDWGWAHWPGSGALYPRETAMSLFIMELVMLCASRSDLISEVRIFPAFAFIYKAPHAPAMSAMNLDGLYNKRGLELLGARTPLSRFAALFTKRLFRRF